MDARKYITPASARQPDSDVQTGIAAPLVFKSAPRLFATLHSVALTSSSVT